MYLFIRLLPFLPLSTIVGVHGLPAQLRFPHKITDEHDPTRKLAFEGYELITRFAKILDGEKIPHHYPVSKPSEKQKLFRRVIIEEDSEASNKPHPRRPHQVRSVDSKNTSVVCSEDLTRSAGTFLMSYADRHNMEPVYKEISATKTVWQQEYIYTCKLGKIAGEGKAKRRSVAKQTAAAQVLRQLISKTRKETVPEELTQLTEKEMEDALVLTCEFIEYGTELEAVCSQENTRPPVFTPLLNKPNLTAGSGFVEMRCKAMGFNAVGFGRDKEVAKRMAAKLVLDQLIDEREKSLCQKGPSTKLDWTI